MTTCRGIYKFKALDALLTTKIHLDAMPKRLRALNYTYFIAHATKSSGAMLDINHIVSLLHKIADSILMEGNIPIDPAQRQ